MIIFDEKLSNDIFGMTLPVDTLQEEAVTKFLAWQKLNPKKNCLRVEHRFALLMWEWLKFKDQLSFLIEATRQFEDEFIADEKED